MKPVPYYAKHISFFIRQLLLLTLSLCSQVTFAISSNDSILNILDRELDKSQLYYAGKEKRIEHLRQQLSFATDKEEQFGLADRLFNEYITYQNDSAFTYALLSRNKAAGLNSHSLLIKASMNLFYCYIDAGLLKEGFELFSWLSRENIPDNMKADYYTLCMRYYVGLMYYSGNDYFGARYKAKALEWIQKAQQYRLPGTSEYALLDLYAYSLSDISSAAKIREYHNILKNHRFSDESLATVYALLAVEYKAARNNEKTIYYCTLSCLSDIRMAIRQTSSKTLLGQTLYEEGNVLFASKCIEASLDDANFYNARHRKIEVNTILPIIENERINIIRQQKKTLTLFMILLAILVIALTGAVFIICKQMRKLRKVRQSIENQYDEISLINSKLKESYRKLEETNRHLEESKKQLEESNEIKDVYIIRSLYGKSEYIERFEKLINKIKLKVNMRQYDDLRNLSYDFNLKTERSTMFSSFDQTFLTLFPNFIEKFNKLFHTEDRILPDKDGNLTPELRIFALIRLGITDNEQIAKFLNLTVKTVYSYKYRTKARSTVPNDEFESYIMHISKREN